MSNIVAINAATGPLAMRQRMQAGTALNKNFTSNVAESFPILSIKGKVFRARIGGQEQALLDPQTRAPLGFLDVILVNASPQLAKSFYTKGFTEGDNDAPNCWSLDSIRPDPSVAQKVSLSCVGCPMNAFGSRITESGKAAKACSDYRRVAVVMPSSLGQVQQGGPEATLFMLKIPQSSLKNLKNHVEYLGRHMFDPQGCVTRLMFDHQEAFPKLLFNFVQPLSNEQYTEVMELAEDSRTAAMLLAPDFDNAPSTQPQQMANQPVAQQPAQGIQPMVQQAAPMMEAVQPVQQGGIYVQPTQPLQQPYVQPAPVVQQAPIVQAAPVVQPVQTAPVQAVQAVQAAPVQGIITLPDGRQYDPATGQFIQQAQAEAQMDPSTVKIPDGAGFKFFNTQRNIYVQGPEMGSPPFVETAVPAKPKRQKAAPAQPAQPPAQQEQAPVQQAQPEAQQAPAMQQVDAQVVQPVVQQAPAMETVAQQPQPNGVDSGIKPTVAMAPRSMTDIIKSVMPKVD